MASLMLGYILAVVLAATIYSAAGARSAPFALGMFSGASVLFLFLLLDPLRDP